MASGGQGHPNCAKRNQLFSPSGGDVLHRSVRGTSISTLVHHMARHRLGVAELENSAQRKSAASECDRSELIPGMGYKRADTRIK